mmetsp:Transcript_89629/g.243115  ORF Transcript_89629/g.243115 Transcript_89629/m.243115 type:complete len:204 (-) Transcript_89629:156-767(-)
MEPRKQNNRISYSWDSGPCGSSSGYQSLAVYWHCATVCLVWPRCEHTGIGCRRHLVQWHGHQLVYKGFLQGLPRLRPEVDQRRSREEVLLHRALIGRGLGGSSGARDEPCGRDVLKPRVGAGVQDRDIQPRAHPERRQARLQHYSGQGHRPAGGRPARLVPAHRVHPEAAVLLPQAPGGDQGAAVRRLPGAHREAALPLRPQE